MTNAQSSLLIGGSHLPACTWLRYNPHEYVDDDHEITIAPSPKDREAWLIEFLADRRLCDLVGLRVLYAFYDVVDLDELGIVPVRALEFDYHERLRAFSFDAHMHAFDAPREIDDATAEIAWASVEELVAERMKRSDARLRAMMKNRTKKRKVEQAAEEKS